MAFKLYPSSAHKWVPCPGSAAMEARQPKPERHPAAKEGTTAHRLAELELRHELWENPNKDMNAHVEDYCRRVREISHGHHLWVEQKLPVPENTTTQVRIDAWFIKDKVLHVIDLKYGFTPVHPYGNWQLIIGAKAVLARLQSMPTRVKLIIFQPRTPNPWREWEIGSDELEGYWWQVIVSSAEAQRTDQPPKVTTGEHCKNCTAKLSCGALWASAEQAVEMSNLAIDYNRPPVELAELYHAYDDAYNRLEMLRDALHDHCLAKLCEGNPLPGLIASTGRGSTAWKEKPETIIQMGEVLGFELYKKKVLTPKQAITAGMDENLVAQLSERRAGKIKLKRDDGSHAKEVFK